MSSDKRPTTIYATISTTIVLIILSLFLLVYFHSTNITNIAKENLNILVELEENLAPDQQQSIVNLIENTPGVKKSSTIVIPKEKASEIMAQEMKLLDSTFTNPFKDLIKFNLTSTSYSEKLIIEIKRKVELEKGVLGLYYENESIDIMKSNLQKISFGILVLALCFVVLAIAIIFNTIKLTLYSDIKQIKTMQMVGADNSFIKKPYLKSAFMMALKAFIAVLLVTGLLVAYLSGSETVFSDILDFKLVGLTLIISFAVAFVLQILTTNSILDRFLTRDMV